MTREGALRIALLAYPPRVRAAREDEMLATALDASAGSGTRFAREWTDLARVGLKTRGAETARAGVRRLVADGLCLAALWVMTLDVSVLLAQRARGMRDPLLATPSIALLAGSLTLALIGLDRLAGAGALVWTALRLPHLMALHPGLGGLAPEILPLACFATLVWAPRRRAPQLRRAVWLLVPALLVVLTAARTPAQNPVVLAAALLAVVLVAAFAVALLPADPRVAIAGAVPLSNLAVTVMVGHADTAVPVWLCLAATPAVLLVAVARAPQKTGSSR